MNVLLDMTITGSITAIILLIIKRIFKNKLSPKWQFYIWAILLIRLLIPSLPESDASLFKNIPSSDQAIVKEYDYRLQESVKIYYSPSGNGQQFITLNSNMLDRIMKIWLIGVALSASYFILVYMVFFIRVNRLKTCENKDIKLLFKRCKSTLHITKDIEILSGYPTPMLTGIFRPKIMIPEGYTMDEMRQIFFHELCHVKYGDVFYNLLNTVLLCVQWFNPIMWIATFTIRRDMELLCDQRVLEITSNRKLYAKVLLKTALRKSKFIPCTTSIQNGEKEIKKRIKFIASKRKNKLMYTIIAVIVMMVVSLICLTNGKESQASPTHHANSVTTEREVDEDSNLIYVVRKKYAPNGHENNAYFEVNYYDIDEKDVNLASDNTLLEYIEYEKLIKRNQEKTSEDIIGEDQYIYEKTIKSLEDRDMTVYSKKKGDGTLVKKIIIP
ncbi:hypothetical protein HZI73_23910 [Vallitalea pronyensis]|uniref:Peptidase M56 domain-containing protein n=1 Tax=Vallitalea pronyensis TaxID=1348613 RepID=A0A8J8SJ58_9FIRM|nr:M56 family metallopeptidase [Vallitalea pronyensis]QUI25152.1 hypothetical protein HZI73_23910 [Vallitalea pronyensis]